VPHRTEFSQKIDAVMRAILLASATAERTHFL
jgi:hypothetical protein